MEEILTLKNVLSQLKVAFWPTSENDFRPVFVQKRFLAYYVLIFLVAKLVILPFYFWLPQTSFFAEVVAPALINLTNEARESHGLWPLKKSATLDLAALYKAQDMLKYGYFDHTSPQGINPWYWFKKVGYSYKAAGENLAIGFVDSQEVSRAWENSFSHRQNLLSPYYKEMGIAVLTGKFQGQTATVVVQLFGSPRTTRTVAVKPSPSTPSTPLGTSPLRTFSPSPTPSASPSPLVVLGTAAQELSLSQEVAVFGSNEYDQLSSLLLGIFFLFIALALALNFFLSLKRGQPNTDLVLETVLFVGLFLAALFIDKGFIINLVPHQLII